jgi:hypothetical protein
MLKPSEIVAGARFIAAAGERPDEGEQRYHAPIARPDNPPKPGERYLAVVEDPQTGEALIGWKIRGQPHPSTVYLKLNSGGAKGVRYDKRIEDGRIVYTLHRRIPVTCGLSYRIINK